MAELTFKAAVAAAMFPQAPNPDTCEKVRLDQIRAAVARATMHTAMTASAGTTAPSGVGARFIIPLLLPEEIESGDGRTFKAESLTLRDLPLPLLWQIKTAEGHDGSVVVGRIDHIERIPEGMGNATGYFDTGHYGREAERLVRNQMLRFVSADLDQFEAKNEPAMTASNDSDDDDDDVIKVTPLSITKSRVMAATIVAKPAYQECKIMIANDHQVDNFPDGEYTDAPALVAAANAGTTLTTITPDTLVDVPVFPPAEWFDNPQLTGATPLTVDRTGRVFGHIASWDQDHIGMPPGTRTPHSASNYAYFHTGSIECADGSRVSVGQITLSGGHAPLSADAAAAVRHYDDTRTAMVDVHAGEDQFGVWVAGAVRPGVTHADLRAFSASAPSGDWRSVRHGQLELVAVCQVNVPGFPVVRAQVASGAVMTLVAAGVQALAASLSIPDEAQRKIAKLAMLRDERRALMASAARARIDERSGFAGYQTLVASLPASERTRLARRRVAMSDGTYPVRNTVELQYAITASARDTSNLGLRCHVVRRARVLGAEDLLPEAWAERSMSPGQLLRHAYRLS